MSGLLEIYQKIGARKKISTSIYLTIAQAIITGILSPEQKIDDINIAQELDVSQNSVREALKLLEFDHYLKFSKGKGYVVENVTLEDIIKINEMLNVLSSASIELINIHDHISSIMLSESLNREQETTNHELDRKFHMTLALCTKNNEVMKAMRNAFDRLMWGINVLQLNDLSSIIIEDHGKIVEYFINNKNASKEILSDIMIKHYNLHLEDIFAKNRE
ncbi:transcriptional regulator PdhR [Oxobacter pfennigii]|uniref:Transcriptional regulator PdhR n=1 Tax=Oxobacter pfennigii TaxID=36849 RepID=A0A0P8WSM7_9CLOT|nr:GntR family transcriptional regulator [Oxobacter pfennigii]KPU45612.1 transcriptional regulator PdhR [Oxobacter pfennigii]